MHPPLLQFLRLRTEHQHHPQERKTKKRKMRKKSKTEPLEAKACAWGSLTNDCFDFFHGRPAAAVEPPTPSEKENSRAFSGDDEQSELDPSPPSDVTVRDKRKGKHPRRSNLGVPNSTAAKEEQSGERLRCSHCGADKTPQWRIGPSGPKTLCNACGVRYKTGGLLPEYRPANSPSFSNALHSNSHRKVVQMRQMKAGAAPEPTPAETVLRGKEYRERRQCFKCRVEEMPLWQPNKLGKACGVRYKPKPTGLGPEHSPADNPSFSPTLKSHSHWKAVEMQQMKAGTEGDCTQEEEEEEEEEEEGPSHSDET